LSNKPEEDCSTAVLPPEKNQTYFKENLIGKKAVKLFHGHFQLFQTKKTLNAFGKNLVQFKILFKFSSYTISVLL